MKWEIAETTGRELIEYHLTNNENDDIKIKLNNATKTVRIQYNESKRLFFIEFDAKANKTIFKNEYGFAIGGIHHSEQTTHLLNISLYDEVWQCASRPLLSQFIIYHQEIRKPFLTFDLSSLSNSIIPLNIFEFKNAFVPLALCYYLSCKNDVTIK